jgi:hypothetical protein
MRDPEGGDVLSRNIFTGDISYLHATALLSRESPLEVRAAKPNCVARKHTLIYANLRERVKLEANNFVLIKQHTCDKMHSALLRLQRAASEIFTYLLRGQSFVAWEVRSRF